MSDQWDNIPDELQERDQWLFWNASKDKPRKALASPAADYGASWSDPDEWHSFETVVEQAEMVPNAGIGYVNAIDNDDYARGLIGSIDIDGVIDEDGHAKDWLPSLEPFWEHDAYIERSPSGTGLRIPVIGLDKPDWWSDCEFDGEHKGVEALTNKFATYTGDLLRGAGDEAVEYGEWIDEWLREVYKLVEGEDPLADDDVETDDDEYTPDGEWLTEEAAEDALDKIDADVGYNTWKDIGMALVNHFGKARGGQLFEQWSRGGSKWDTDAKDQADRIVSDAGNYNYDAGTIVYHATNSGWDASQAAREYGRSSSSESGATDGGATAASGSAESPTRDFEDRVRRAIQEFRDDIIPAKTARHNIARAFVDEFHFVFPEQEVRGWRETLYVFNTDSGVYEPRGEVFVEKKLERVASDFATNQVTNEIIGKIERMSIERGSQFRRSPERLVVGNGILDLHTGELTPHTATEYHRSKINIDWNPDAGEPEAIDSFLHEIVDDSDVPTLYRLIAHSLYKEYVTERAAMLIGSGQNGKSVFLDFVEKFLGEHNVSHRSLQAFEDDFKANQLEGKLANIHPDMGDRAVKDMSTFKKLTGRDTFLADVKYETPIEFENYATLLFAANEMPAFSEDNHAIWRRWVYVDFPNTFDDSDPDAKEPEPKRVIMRRLTQDSELEALLLRCQQEIQRWYEGGDWYADAMDADEVREKMKKAAEPIYAFASACLEVGGDGDDYVEKSVVRAAYNAYADAEDLPKVPENKFGEELMALRDYPIESGQRRDGGSRVRVYNNVTLSARGRQVLGLDEPETKQNTVDDAGDEFEQAKPIVMQRLKEMVEENGGDPVPAEGVIWGCTSEMGKASAEQALDKLIQSGDVMESDGSVIPF